MPNGPHYLRPSAAARRDASEALEDAPAAAIVDAQTGALVPYYPRTDAIVAAVFSDADGASRADSAERQLHVTGLRRRRLIALLGWLAVLSILSILLLILNITLINVLQMTTHGMRSLQIHSYVDVRTGRTESAVRFAAQRVDLGHVVASAGKVMGSREKRLEIQATQISINAGHGNISAGASLINSDCKFENIDHFLVSSGLDGRILFNASDPQVFIDHRIRQIATRRIITNKIRAPIGDPLRVDAEDLSLRGNEAIHLDAKTINATARTSLRLKTSADGATRLASRRLFVGSEWRPLPVSSSPALTASLDAYRVCICTSAVRPRIFLVAGNKPCQAPDNFCK